VLQRGLRPELRRDTFNLSPPVVPQPGCQDRPRQYRGRILLRRFHESQTGNVWFGRR